MTKRIKYTAICKEWKLVNLPLLRPRSTCKVWISYADVSFGMSFMIIQIIYKLKRRLLRFVPCCDGVFTAGGGIRKAGFKGGDGVRLSLSSFWETCVNSGVTLKGLRGVENAVVAVEESCVLNIKSGTVLIISSGRVTIQYNTNFIVNFPWGLFRDKY